MEVVDLRNLRPPDEIGPLRRGLLLPVLAPLAGLYGAAAWLRRRMPRSDVGVGAPVISVGSLAVGGTGKTPVTMMIAERFIGRGRSTAIVSRGYRRRNSGGTFVVGDGSGTVADIGPAGDEPHLMARRLPRAKVVVGRDRVAAASRAVTELGADLIILDDGFQHRRLRRQVDVVCLDSGLVRGGGWPLPLGTLREGWSALDPGCVIVEFARRSEPTSEGERSKHLEGRRIFVARETEPVILDAGGSEVARGALAGARVMLLSGIARPSAFERSARAAGIEPAVSLRYGDHHWYDDSDLHHIAETMKRQGCSLIVTTEKDLFKLPESLRRQTLALRVGVSLDSPSDFWNLIDSRIGPAAQP
jgi:tetraacyldisaccharide 4'-kinase